MNVRDPYEWISQQESRIAALKDRADQARDELTRTGATRTSDDGAVTVTVGPGGQVLDIRLSARADDLGHQRLQDAIMTTIRSAQAASIAMTTEVMETLLGSDSDAMGFLRSQMPVVSAPDETSGQARIGEYDPDNLFEGDDNNRKW